MNFYIRQIKLWFKKNVAPKVYEFEPNKVNVITGDSSTGKSSVLRIIDYCLLSPHSTIVEDVINHNVKWYGLAFQLNGIDYVVARLNPRNETAEQRMYFAEATDFPQDMQPNTTRGELLLKFNQMFHTPNATFQLDRKREVRLNFRHFLIFTYLTEDIIATMNTYFDTRFFGTQDYDFFIDDFLKVALGIDDVRLDKLKKQYAEESKRLKIENKRQEDFANKEKTYNETLVRLKDKFVTLGLESGSLFEDTDTTLKIIKAGLQNYKRYCDDDKVVAELAELKKKRRNLTTQINKYKGLKNEYERYQKTAISQDDSLVPLTFLNEHIEDVLEYDETRLLVQSLQNSLQKIKQIKERKMELPENFEQRYQTLLKQRQETETKISKLNSLTRRSEDVRWMHDAVKLMFDLEKLKKPIFKGISEADYINLSDAVTNLQNEISRFISNKSEVMNALDTSINRYYGSQNAVSLSYNSCIPHFNIEERMLMLKSCDSNFYKRNVGSKSNYMFMHLCFFLGLHDFLLKQKDSFVPNFLFIDQPSIPYYADKNKNNDTLQNDDEKKLKEAFSLINRFMDTIIGYEGYNFQIIMIEHADSEYWETYNKYFSTKYVFTKDKDYGLIPEILAQRT